MLIRASRVKESSAERSGLGPTNDRLHVAGGQTWRRPPWGLVLCARQCALGPSVFAGFDVDHSRVLDRLGHGLRIAPLRDRHHTCASI